MNIRGRKTYTKNKQLKKLGVFSSEKILNEISELSSDSSRVTLFFLLW